MNKDNVLLKKNLLFWITLLINLFSPLANISFAFSIKYIINDGIDKNFSSLYFHLCISIFIVIVFILINYEAKKITTYFAEQRTRIYRIHLMRYILKQSYKEFYSTKSEDYNHYLLDNSNKICKDYICGFFNIIRNFCLILYSLIGMLFSNLFLAVIVIIATLIPMFLSGILAKSGESKKNNMSISEKKYHNKINDYVNGYLVIKNYQIESQVLNKFKLYLNEYTKSHLSVENSENVTSIFSELSGLIVFLVAFGGGMIMTANGYTTAGSVTAIVQLVNYVVMPINELGILFSRFNGSKLLISNSIYFDKVNGHFNLLKKESAIRKITMKNVSFKYPNNSYNILNNIDLDLFAGKKYVITGGSGSGKSTLFKLLLKFFEPSDGKILINNTNLNEISSKWWYSQVAIVQQDTFIFDDTIKYNIKMDRDFSDSDVLDAMLKSGLGDLLKKINYNLNYECGEKGSNLSGGQKQRISIARAILQKKSLILLDEATSSLDKINSSIVENLLLNDSSVTLISITHNVEEDNLKKYDKILKLNNGTF